MLVRADPDSERIFFQAVVESHDPEIAQCVRRHNEKVYGVIRRLVTQAQQEGHIAAEIDPDAATWGYMSVIIACQRGLMLNNADEIVRVQPEMSRIWLRGLRAGMREKEKLDG